MEKAADQGELTSGWNLARYISCHGVLLTDGASNRDEEQEKNRKRAKVKL